ncbi:MAG: DinB family protein [Bacteroidota bacterium]
MKGVHQLFKHIPTNEYDLALRYYTDKAVDGTTVPEVLTNSTIILKEALDKIPEDKIKYRYGFGKWTVGEVLQHLISYERIMTERALMIAGIIQSGFKYQHYTQASTAKGGSNKTKTQLVAEFLETRAATLEVFSELSNEQLLEIGTLDGFKTSVRMISLCISGHQIHHFKVLQEKYQVL